MAGCCGGVAPSLLEDTVMNEVPCDSQPYVVTPSFPAAPLASQRAATCAGRAGGSLTQWERLPARFSACMEEWDGCCSPVC